MAKFIIKKKGEDDILVDAPTIEVGSRSTCAVWLDDPMIAERHCRITGLEGGQFAVDDLQTTTGTYLNAEPVTKPTQIPPTAELILGISRVQLSVDAATATLTITSDEKKTFYYDRRVDPLVWSRSEVKFGRSRVLKLANLAFLASAVILLPLSFLPPTTDKILDPGPLLHESITKDRFHRDYHQMLSTLSGSDQDCDACHADFAGTPIDKCVACHQETMQHNHPRIANAETWQVGCVHCHVEHRGTEAAVLTNQRDARGTCGLCHEDDRKRTADSKVVVKLKETAYAFNTFAHADHAAKKGLACLDCHGFSDVPWQDDAGRWREFSVVRYKQCMDCHKEGAVHAKASEKRYKVDWHGAAEDPSRCTQCHEKSHDAAMRQTDFTPVTRAFEYEARSHQADFEKFKSHPKDGCTECHKNGIELLGGKPIVDGIFEHGTHVSTLKPADDAAKLKVSAECSKCHDERAKSPNLVSVAEGRQHFKDASCTECHDAKAGASPFTVKPTPSGAAIKRTEFPHDKHLAISGGCFACHVFVQDPAMNAAFRALPLTIPEAKDCSACHSDHQKIAGDSCQECHKPASGNLAADAVYWNDVAKWAKARRPIGTGFSHTSPGHRDLVNPAVPECGRCHDERKVWESKSLAEVPIPDENDALCTACHITDKKRFHFMLSETPPK